MRPLIEIKNLKKTYHMGETEVRALDGVSLKIEAGDFVAIMGASGSGKSTLMHILGLLDVPDSGSYSLEGRDVSGASEDELAALRGRTVGFVFQQFNLLARTPALENASLPMLYSEGVPPDRPAQLLKEIGLGDRLDHKPSQLSGGQQQRVAIARSLVNDPSILMADEPTGNLDTKSSREIMDHLVALNKKGITVVLVTHEEDIARYARRVLRMRDGKIISDRVARALPRSRTMLKTTPPVSPDFGAMRLFRDAANYFRQARRALSTNKVRALLSMLGILIGVAAVVAMLALGAGMQHSMESSFASMGTNLLIVSPGAFRRGPVVMSQGAVTKLTLDDADDMRRQVPHAKRVAAEVDGAAQVTANGKNWSTRVTGGQADWGLMRNSMPTWGRFFTDNEDRARARVAVIGLTVSRNLFGTANPIGETIKVNRVSFQVIGLLPEKGSNGWQDQDDLVLVPCGTAMHRLMGKEFVDMIDVEVDDPKYAALATQAITDLIVKRHHITDDKLDSFNVRNMADMQATMNQIIGGFALFLFVVAFISLVVGGIGIMNIMLVSVTERTREIGLRKALGARRKDILSQFLIEALFIGLLGGLLGLAVGSFFVLIVTQFMNWALLITPGSVALAVLFAAGVGVAAGLWPAFKASRLNPIDALRYE